MFCEECGKQLPMAASYCPACGQRVILKSFDSSTVPSTVDIVSGGSGASAVRGPAQPQQATRTRESAPGTMGCPQCGSVLLCGHDYSGPRHALRDDAEHLPPATVSQPSAASALVPEIRPLASSYQRFATAFLDLFFAYAFVFMVGVVLAVAGTSSLLRSIDSRLVALTLFAIYYVPQEAYDGRTLGKRIMKTRAMGEEGHSLSFGQAVGRFACRLIPFEAFSFLAGEGRPRGWHDRIPRTLVVDLREPQGGLLEELYRT